MPRASRRPEAHQAGPPGNLPGETTSFIGREQEVGELATLLSSTRLLTLTGVGGSGKTRLALHVATRVGPTFRDGVWMVDLASLIDPELLPRTVAASLRLSEESSRPAPRTLVAFLATRELLLVLDNCEHLVPACSDLAAALLRECPSLHILATSREALGAEGETVWLVPPMSLPEQHAVGDIEQVISSEAVQLFAARARAAVRSFRLTPQNAPAVVEICRRLDGIPLGIELAAARVRALAVEQIADRLGDRFELLTEGPRGSHPRHQTLRAAIDWSFSLLLPEEATLMRRLSVFAGGFTLDAAEGVCAGTDAERRLVLDALGHLVDKSLLDVTSHHAPAARYRMLETIRQYAAELLATHGEVPAVRRRHVEWFRTLAEQAGPNLRGSGQAQWVARLDAELDNVRGALDWCRSDERSVDPGLRLAAALGFFWDIRGLWQEGRQWLEVLLARRGTGAPDLLAEARMWAGILAYRQGEYEEARAHLTAALSTWDESPNASAGALAMHFMGHLAHAQGDPEGAARLLSLSVDQFRGLGDRWGIAYSLSCLGDIARITHDDSAADEFLRESLRLHQVIGDPWGAALAALSLGHLAMHQRRYDDALALIFESLRGFRQVGGPRLHIIYCLAALAGVAAQRGELLRAATLLGAVAAHFPDPGSRLEPPYRGDYEGTLARIRHGLTTAAFTQAQQAGAAMTFEQVLGLAEAQPAPAKVQHGSPLTPRERQVAALVSRGLSNHEIARQMQVSPRTAETHVQHILNKLGFDSRAQIAAWAVEQRLLDPRPN